MHFFQTNDLVLHDKAKGGHSRIAFYVPNQKQTFLTFLMLNSKHSATGAASRQPTKML